MKVKVSFRRNNKEAYFVCNAQELYQGVFAVIIDLLEKTKTEKLELLIEKVSPLNSELLVGSKPTDTKTTK